MDTLENKAFWEFVEKTAQEVSNWPERTRAEVGLRSVAAAPATPSNADAVRAGGSEENSK
jgi:hypothetical protein